MTDIDALIKRMTDRFLGWKLPEDFQPDCGIEFDCNKYVRLNPMSLRDEIAHRLRELRGDHWWLGRHLYQSEADAILALVRAHLTSDESVLRAVREYNRKWEASVSHRATVRAAILAALGEGE